MSSAFLINVFMSLSC